MSLMSYLSISGRLRRRDYWRRTLAVLGILLAGSLLAYLFRDGNEIAVLMLAAVGAISMVVGIVVTIASAVRRLHDRNKSGWWLLLFLFLPTLLNTLAGAGGDEGAAFALIGLPFSIWGLIEIGILRGTIGPNRFGEDPLPPPAGFVRQTEAEPSDPPRTEI